MQYEKIFYLGYYNLPDSGANFALSAVNKMDYIISAVESLNMSVNVVSATTRKDGKKPRAKSKNRKKFNPENLRQLSREK